jgi:uncharacterized membrane protein
MVTAAIVRYTATLTFGRATAQFKQLITVMAVISIVIWIIVLLTMFARIGAYQLWYRRRLPNSRNNPPI